MLCDKCKKNNATVHITRIINGVMEEQHLCAQCAGTAGEIFSSPETIGWQNLFSGFYKMQEPDPSRCPQCGLTYGEFRENGKMGCPQCYREFSEQMPKLLEGIHGSCHHRGKIPVSSGGKSNTVGKLAAMKQQLEQLVSTEKFEEAAVLRDQIKALEEKGGEA